VTALNWIDDPTLIRGGILTGFNGPYEGVSLSPLPQYFVDSEGPSKANRKNYLMHTTYSPLTPPANVNVETSIMDGSLFGDPRVVIISALGFDQFSPGWPAGGLADFISGAMDSTIQAWCNLLNTLPPRPFLFRLWREMLSPGVIYGPNGASLTPNHGVNETASTYVTAWRYVVGFIRARCSWARILWCPDTESARPLTDTTPYYPGDAYVDWNGLDSYVSGSALTIEANMAPLYGGFNSTTGTISRKPFMVCETQTDRADTTRIGDIQHYTTAFQGMSGIAAVCFWDSDPGGQYEITDTPAGYLSAFQGVVGAAPFLGVPAPVTAITEHVGVSL
jgi:glycosyl hydrolase family 26